MLKTVKKLPKKRRRPVSKSVGAIIVNRNRQVLLVFQSQNKYWEFPKGKTEAGERELQTLKRELFEEVSMTNLRVIKPFRQTVYYNFRFEGRLIRRKVIYYLVRCDDPVRLSDEHDDFEWLSIDEARKRLRHDTQKKLITKVEKLIETHDQRNQTAVPVDPQTDRPKRRTGALPGTR